MMKILITGNLGFVGTQTSKLITKAGHSVIGYDIMNGFDILDIKQFEQTIVENQPDRILHLAAIARFSEADNNPKLAFETNVVGTKNVTAIAKKYHIPLIFSSTGSVYMPIEQKPPINEKFPIRGNSIYGCSKAIAEKYITEHFPHIILRYAHLYGNEKRGHGLIGGFIDRIERGLRPILFGGQQSNDFCYIKDIARANLLALEASFDKWNNAYNIGTGEELTAERAGNILCQQIGYKGKIELKKFRTVDPKRFYYNIDKADQMLKFKAEYTFNDGLKDMFKNNKNEPSISKHIRAKN